jgi:hypothetical protein
MAQKWGDDRMFVAVRRDNAAASDMYLRMGFSLCLDEAELINRKLTSPPRLFYSKILSTPAPI